jgi:cytochrome c556
MELGMKRMVLAFVALSLATGAVVAEGDVIAQRKQTMKGVGEAYYRDLGKMIKGQTPFNEAKAKASFATIQAAAKKMPGLFPDTSKTGGETNALPKIWEDQATFEKGFATLGSSAATAQAEVKDLATLKTQFGVVGKSCDGCHENFRAKMN